MSLTACQRYQIFTAEQGTTSDKSKIHPFKDIEIWKAISLAPFQVWVIYITPEEKALCGARPFFKSRPSLLLACRRPSGPSAA